MENEFDTHESEQHSVGETPGIRAGGERRSRRSAAHTSAFRAIKARHSHDRSRMEIFASRLTEIASGTGFFFFHVFAFSAWIVWNLGLFGLPQFDPFPYGLLTMIVSLEAIFLSIFVLMSQSRESAIGELREMLRPLDPEQIEHDVTAQIEEAIPRLQFKKKNDQP